MIFIPNGHEDFTAEVVHRVGRYADYEEMDEYPEISDPFSYSDDATPVED